MKKTPLPKLVEQLQKLLNEISVTPKDNLARFLHLKKRAVRVLNRIKREHPEAESFHLRGPALSVRREGQGPAGGAMETPDTPEQKP